MNDFIEKQIVNFIEEQIVDFIEKIGDFIEEYVQVRILNYIVYVFNVSFYV